MATTAEALDFARLKHLGQIYGHLPYYSHIVDTVNVAKELGLGKIIEIAAALHDILEDTPLSYNDVASDFGTEIADIVYDVTDELGKNRKERKERTYPKIKANHDAILVKFCDRIANLRYSKAYNKNMYTMYLKENDSFVAGTTQGVHFDDKLVRCLKALNDEKP